MEDSGRPWLRRLAFVPVLAVGVVAFLALKASRAEPEKITLTETGRRVRTLSAQRLQIIPRATGYGVVQAREEWQMIAEVSGRVVEFSDQLKEGGFIKKGTVLVRIDPADYQLTETQKEANLEGVRAQISQIRVQETSARKTLKIEERSLELAESSLARLRKLQSSGAVSQSDVDAEERTVLGQRKAVQSLRNTLRELPTNRKVLEAQLKQEKAGLAGASRDIARTEIVAPYDIRIRSVATALEEVVGSGQVLAVADGLDMAEIPAQYAIGELRPLVPFRPNQTPISTDALSRLPELIGLTAKVRLESTDLSAEWDANFDRFTTVDPKTRTVGVVVTIADPYTASRSAERPPVVPGMYMEVQLEGRPRDGCLALPRAALHGNIVYVANAERRLERREVEVDFRQSDYVCLRSGVAPGDQVIVTDLIPAIEGMLLDPAPDQDAAKQLATATGQQVQPK